MINVDENRKRLVLYLSMKCEHCKDYLKEMLYLLLLSDKYFLSIKIMSNDPIKDKRDFIARIVNEVKSTNCLSDDSFITSYTCIQNDSKIIDRVNSDEIRVPMLVDNGFIIDTMFNAELTKAHLVLSEYGG